MKCRGILPPPPCPTLPAGKARLPRTATIDRTSLSKEMDSEQVPGLNPWGTSEPTGSAAARHRETNHGFRIPICYGNPQNRTCQNRACFSCPVLRMSSHRQMRGHRNVSCFWQTPKQGMFRWPVLMACFVETMSCFDENGAKQDINQENVSCFENTMSCFVENRACFAMSCFGGCQNRTRNRTHFVSCFFEKRCPVLGGA